MTIIFVFNILVTQLEPLLKKSIESSQCAAFLSKQREKFASIIPISYFSTFQLISHIIIDILDRNIPSLEEEIKDSKKKYNKGKHFVYTELIYKELLQRKNDWAVEFRSEMKQLKQMRVDCDYENKDVEPNDISVGYIYSQNINRSLIEIFRIKP